MKTISKFSILISVIFIFLSLSTCKTSKNVTESNTLDENRIVYWFYIYISFDKVAEPDVYSYDIKHLTTEPVKGTAKEYDYLFWKFLSEGSKFAVGPFNSSEEARKSLVFYTSADKMHTLDDSFNSEKDIYWFVLKVKLRDRSRSWELVRVPGAIASGKYEEFDVFLSENLKTGVLTIGPFQNMPDAEESKRVYRLH
jgi:hypothetical protein